MTEATINQQNTYKIALQKGETFINDAKITADIHKENAYLQHVLCENASFKVAIHKIDKENKEVILTINGKKVSVALRSQTEILLASLGLNKMLATKLEAIKAPMPGLIQRILVTEGQSVQKGEPLLILEAMKMENVIKAPENVTVDKILVAEKTTVEKGGIMISFK